MQNAYLDENMLHVHGHVANIDDEYDVAVAARDDYSDEDALMSDTFPH